jgi:Protein of unknown function (DUF2924)
MPNRHSGPGPTSVGSDARIEAELEALAAQDIQGLRKRWQKILRKPAPAHVPRYLLLRMIAYRIQADVFGDLDRETIRFLDQVAQDWQSRRRSGEIRPRKTPPPIPPVPSRRSLKPGSILVREHAGELQRVVVLENGFAWNGTTYQSLSEVARAMTGTNWSGPRFFGLRDRSPQSPASEEVPA